MLKHRIIPILLWDGKQCVQSVKFQRPHRPVGSMMQHIKIMERRNIDELIILDVNATIEKRKPLFDEIKEFTSQLYCPVTYGGGITELKDIELLLKAGADKVAIKHRYNLINVATEKFGRQCIVKSVDSNGLWFEAVEQGAGEILLTSMDNNGTMKGYDENLLIFYRHLNIPIIINGGCGNPQHMIEAIQAGASAVAASTMFLFSSTTPRDCAEALHAAGIPVRL